MEDILCMVSLFVFALMFQIQLNSPQPREQYANSKTFICVWMWKKSA
jgi:hypothetical protein